MIGHDLYKPLPARPVRRVGRLRARVAAVTAASLLFAAGAYVVLKDDGGRGEPFAVGTIAVRQPTPIPAAEPTRVAASSPVRTVEDTGANAGPTLIAGSQAQMENGVMVIRAVSPGGSSPLTLKVPEASPAPFAFRQPDPSLIEASASGPLPRIGRDGERPAAAYAAAPLLLDGKPRIAILIGGMGLDRAATADAAHLLPAGVTFGFAPYGPDLAEQVSRVRAAGHEVILQVPMEDFGKENHPFPHMLKVAEADNTTSLHWLMSRFAGYAGVGNYLGGRLMSDEGSLKPLLQDIEARGLYFVDDGTAPRSLAGLISKDLGLAGVKADVVLDAAPDAAAVATALATLERIARQRGFAFGTAAGRSTATAVIETYLADAARRGIVVVPISQALAGATTGNVGIAKR